MLITRGKLESLYNITLKLSSKQFSIQTQYKFLKLKKSLLDELDIYREQRAGLQRFFELDEEGNPIMLDANTIKIKEGEHEELYKVIDEIESVEIQIPDIYFSLDELENLGLTLDDLETLDQFIKE